MRTPKATGGKIRNGGALRGAQNIAKKIFIKTEPQDLAQILVQSESRERLKKRIIEKRRARGEVDLQIEPFDKPVKHELSPEEIERRERRKEQNRRAAQRCRQKKKLLQVDVVQSFSAIQEDNERLEEEVRQLKKEKLELQEVLNAHMLSGACKQVKLENLENQAVPLCTQYAHGASSSSSQVLPAPPLTLPVTSAILATTRDAMLTTSAALPVTSTATGDIPFATYLADMGRMEPSETFVDLVELCEELKSDGFPSATVTCNPNGTLDTEKVLQSLVPTQSQCMGGQFLSPISPVTYRCSVSSVSSEYSAISDQSRGFCPDYGYGEPDQRLSSTPLLSESMEQVHGVGNHQDFIIDLLSDDDDVFNSSRTITNDDTFRQYMTRNCNC